jgi:hypothetical protein
MWKLLYRTDGLVPLRVTFQEHVTKAGLDAVARANQGTIGPDGKQENMVSIKDRRLHCWNIWPLSIFSSYRLSGSQELRSSAVGGIQEECHDRRKAF